MGARMITATLPMPPSTNNLYANAPGKGRVKTREYRNWITVAGHVLKIAAAAKQIDGPYALILRVGKPDNRRRDLSNTLKPLEDLLVAMGVVRDDSDCQRIETSWTAEHHDVFITVLPTEAIPPIGGATQADGLCPQCNGPVLRKSDRAVFCSSSCKDQHWIARRQEAARSSSQGKQEKAA